MLFNNGIAQTEQNSLQLINQASNNAKIIAEVRVKSDPLRLFTPMSDDAFCAKVDSNFYSFLDLSGQFMNPDSKTEPLQVRHWKIGELRFSACYLADELQYIHIGSFINLIEGDSKLYQFYQGELVRTRNECWAYVGAICNGEYSFRNYTWRNGKIICQNFSRDEEIDDPNDLFFRCYCAVEISEKSWLDDLREVLFYMHHLKPDKVDDVKH